MDVIQKISTRAKRNALHLHRNARNVLGLNHNFFCNARGSRMLVYHGICKSDHLLFNTIFLTEETFEDHLKFYKKYFHVVSLDDYYSGNFHPDKFNVCLTFDDGFANNHKYVLPLLEQYQVPATFFITAIRDAGYDILWNDFMAILGKYGPEKLEFDGGYQKNRCNKYISKTDGKSLTDTLRSTGFDEKATAMTELYSLFPFKNETSYEDYWLQMTRQQIKEMSASPYVTIGGHGYYHNDLSQIEIANVRAELQQSKTWLEEIIQKPVNSIAFPYGAYTMSVTEAAKQGGYSQLLALDFNRTQDKADIALRERFTVNPFISVTNQMYATVNGYYE